MHDLPGTVEEVDTELRECRKALHALSSPESKELTREHINRLLEHRTRLTSALPIITPSQ